MARTSGRKIEITVSGFDEFLEGLEDMKHSRINQAAKRALRHAVQPMRKQAAQNATQMVNHLNLSGIRPITRQGHNVSVPYFPFGSKFIIKSGVVKSGGRGVAGFGVYAVVGPEGKVAPHAGLIEFGVPAYGIKANPVMRNAFKQTKSTVLKRLAKNMKVQLEREWKKIAKKMNKAKAKAA